MEKEDDDATVCCRQEPSRRFEDVNEESLLAASIIMILSPFISPIVSAYIALHFMLIQLTHHIRIFEKEVKLRTLFAMKSCLC